MNETEDVQIAIERHGLVLVQDAKLPNVVRIVSGETLRGSWWSHRDANRIFAVVESIEAHPDNLATKLVAGKVTFLHRRLWPALLGVALAREAWQTRALSSDARALCRAIDRGESMQATGPAAKSIEIRLLARSEQVHTESGKHVTRLEPWSVWAKRVQCAAPLAVVDAKRMLEAAVIGVGGISSLLPWHERAGKSRVQGT